MHGLEQQTLESLELIKTNKTPFIVALNKVDRLHEWKSTASSPIQASLKNQKENTLHEFETRLAKIKVEFAEQGFNSALYFENQAR